MRQLFSRILNLLLPVRQNVWVRDPSKESFDEVMQDICLSASDARIHEQVQYTLRYREAGAKMLIWKFKYFLNPEALRICTYILYDQLIADASDRVAQIPFRIPHVLLHYPSSTYFKGKKKFDHMKELTLLLDSMQHTLTPFFVCCTHAVLPNKDFSRQTDGRGADANAYAGAQHTGSRTQRFKWSKERFVLSKTFEMYMESHPEVRHIYCIDDVVTTGASMHAVSNMIEKKFAVEVRKFCICH